MIRSNKIVMLGTSVVALLAAVAGCAAESSDDNTGLPIATGGTAVGTGGIGAGTGGYATTGGVGTGTGGLTPGAGGFTPGAGGTTPGAGGTTTGGPVVCTGAATLDGYMDNGTMCGRAYTGVFADGGTIQPPCGTAGPCFTGATLCNTGDATIPASTPQVGTTPGKYPGIMIGWNVSQAADSAIAGKWTSTGTGLTANFSATGATGETRVVLKTAAGDYCAKATSGTAIPWSSFKISCWDAASTSVFTVGTPVEAVMVQINAVDTGAQTVTNFCLNSVTNN